MEEQPEGTQSSGAEHQEGFASEIKAENVQFNDGLVGFISANQDVTFTDGAAFGVAVGRDMQVTDGGAFAMAVGHDMDVMNGGAVLLSVGGSTEITNGGSVLSFGKQVNAQNSFFGVLISNETNLEAGSRVLLDTRQAAAFGAAFGAVFALLSLLLRRR